MDEHDAGTWWICGRDEFYRRLHAREAERMRSLGDKANATATAMSRPRLTRRQLRQLEEIEEI